MRARLLALMTLMFGLLVGPASAAPILSISPSTTTTAPGGTFSVNVDVADVTDLFAYEFNLSYDPVYLAVSNYTVFDQSLNANVSVPTIEGSFFGNPNPLITPGPSSFFIPGTDDLNGLISLIANTLIGNVPGISGSGTLATVTFIAKIAGSTSISLLPNSFVDSTLTEIEFGGTNNAAVTIVSTVPEPATLVLFGTGLAVAARRRLTRSRKTI